MDLLKQSWERHPEVARGRSSFGDFPPVSQTDHLLTTASL
jgi:hypothetical protein